MNALLRPFASLFAAIVRLRNYAFDSGLLSAYRPKQKVLSIGNLSTGGTGKTPHTLMVAAYLQGIAPTAVLSRGYGRKTKGFRWVLTEDAARDSGDEPLLIKRRLPEMQVAVCEDRSEGARRIAREAAEVRVLVLDDAYQHRRIERDGNVLLTRFDRPFFTDHALPEGRLRENRSGASRADAVIVTHCPMELSKEQATHFQKQIQRYTPAPVFFTHLMDEGVFDDAGKAVASLSSCLAVAGIAYPHSFFGGLRRKWPGIDMAQLAFADHRDFSASDMQRIRRLAARHDHTVVTTEKDRMRWPQALLKDASIRLYHQRIGLRFHFDQQSAFERHIRELLALRSRS